MSGTEQRGVRKERTGVVTSDGMNKTIVVEVSQRYRHPLYGKVVIRKKKFHAHDEKNITIVSANINLRLFLFILLSSQVLNANMMPMH